MRKTTIIWISIFTIGCIFRGTHLFQPVNTNSWREADVATIARNFFENGTDIFHPQINYGGSGPGYTESEFQIYSYMIALSYKVFGVWEPIGRIISFLFSLATMIVFFKLSRHLLNTRTAIFSSFFFAISPVLSAISIGIQPDATTFFFYLSAVYLFIRWLENGKNRFYWLTFFAGSMALLAKLTAANLGIFFVWLIIARKGWKFLFKPSVLLLGFLIMSPSAIWYSYGRHFYVQFGNSLGLSNEYPWMGWDFFTSKEFILGIIKVEISNVWTLSGPPIVLLAMITTQVYKDKNFKLGIYWFTSVLLFYILTCRTTASDWAWYYHIFSPPSVSILLGASVVALYDKYCFKTERENIPFSKTNLKRVSILVCTTFLFSFYILLGFRYLVKTKKSVYHVSPFYACVKTLKKMIPENALILTNGSLAKDDKGYSLAVPIGFFFYWLDKKGYCISIEDLSEKNILAYRKLGVNYFVAEEQKLALVPKLEALLKNDSKVVFDCNGCILFEF